jgi:Na+/H+ antiporter NhaD/arsenite permease-like protein
MTKEEVIVKTLLKEKVSQLQNLRSKRIYEIKQDTETNFRIKTDDLIQNYKIHSYPLLIKCSIVFMITLILFFVHPFLSTIHLTIGWISILSAIVLITLTATTVQHSSNQHSESTSFNGIDLEAIIHKIEWSTLLFFACLFIFMKCIEELGLLHDIGEVVSNIVKSVDNKNDRLVVAITIIMVTSSLVSAVIDNIPFTTGI